MTVPRRVTRRPARGFPRASASRSWSSRPDTLCRSARGFSPGGRRASSDFPPHRARRTNVDPRGACSRSRFDARVTEGVPSRAPVPRRDPIARASRARARRRRRSRARARASPGGARSSDRRRRRTLSRGPISTFSTFSTFSTSTTPTVARDFARSRDREIAIGENGEKKKKEATGNRARARGGGVPTARAPPRSPPSRAFDRHSTTPTRRVPGPRPNANERANDAERFVRTDHSYARARRRSHRARAGGLYDRPSLADASAAGPSGLTLAPACS